MVPCQFCGEDFDQTERVEEFCSWECAQAFADASEAEQDYREARCSGAPVFE